MNSQTKKEEPADSGAGRTASGAGPALLRLEGLRKRYGRTQALDGADLDVREAEVLGLVGHNGAGKSTLMRVVVGITEPDSGEIRTDTGEQLSAGWSPEASRAAGVRIVFQELSLSPALRVFENVLVSQPQLGGRGWRPRTRRLIERQLDEIFPGHGISPWARIETLTLAQRQMVEIAQATLDVGPLRLVILDEPTSALDRDAAGNLFRFIRRARERGVSFILISHRIGEVLENTDRVSVMRDGRVVAAQASAELTEDDLVTQMGGTALSAIRRARESAAQSHEPVVEIADLTTKRLRNVSLVGGRGEVVGLAGLEGQGQQELLFELWRRRNGRLRRSVDVGGRMAFVTGNRQDGGVFPLWPLSLNVTIGSLAKVTRRGAVSRSGERRLADDWIARMGVRGQPSSAIGDLSGGNQQKVLIARALAADADVILLDDPFRGVDISTRQETYKLIRDEAASNDRCFLWFSTENQELEQCDRVYVFREGMVVAELEAGEITEENLIAASFARADGAAAAEGEAES